jgi:hypothetical protein
LLKKFFLLTLVYLIALSLFLPQLLFPLLTLFFATISAWEAIKLFRVRYGELVWAKFTCKSNLWRIEAVDDA